ncbi:hypothetical protein N658DRAFT_498270 [Parathielavia hyrcaniae]|uniref:Uncharacterized protein n=1 Tax=Parathielavia hyrcaniae TaxID=113614 RepID=A0AAN6PX36_9PEZI|nr:hypothetical protein N658DRAFT_498270 [Parathielavia hyrcaniae]
MRNLQLSTCLALLAAGLVNAVTLQDNGHDYALLLSRQAPGTPQYECHSNCGNVISGARTPDYCDDSTWVDAYEACLDCAMDFNIWRYYGSGVGNAATACGLTAVPSPSGDAPSSPASTASSTSSAESMSSTPSSSVESESTVVSSSTVDSPSNDVSSSDAASVTTSSSIAPSNSTITAAPSTGTEPATSSATSTTSAVTAGAARSDISSVASLLSVGAMVAVFVTLLGPW